MLNLNLYSLILLTIEATSRFSPWKGDMGKLAYIITAHLPFVIFNDVCFTNDLVKGVYNDGHDDEA